MVEVENTANRRKGKPPVGLKPAMEIPDDIFEVEDDVHEPLSVPRAEMRPTVRNEDHLARAKLRTAELKGQLGDLDEGHDDFYIPEGSVPEGWTIYFWRFWWFRRWNWWKFTGGRWHWQHAVNLTKSR